MTGQEIRAWAWDSVKGRRKVLVPAILLTMVPPFIQTMLMLVYPGLWWTYYPVFFFSMILHMGCSYIALGLADGEHRSVKDLFVLLDRGRIASASVVALILIAVHVLLYNLDAITNIALHFLLLTVVDVILVPLSTVLAIDWEKKTNKLILTSIGMGFKKFVPLLGFYLCTVGVLSLATVVILLLGLMVLDLSIITPLVIWVLFLWMLPYTETAKVLFVRELFFPGQTQRKGAEQTRSVRFMRQYSGGGGWYWCPMDRGPVWTKIPVCRRRRKKG